MQNNKYQNFLQKKIDEQHSLVHMLSIELKVVKQKNQSLLNQITRIRKKNEKLNYNNKSYIENIKELQDQLKAAKGIPLIAPKSAIKKCNIKQIKIQKTPANLVFKEVLENTFPIYKSTIKNFLRIIMIVEKHAQKNQISRIQTYYQLFGKWIKKIIDFISPKKSQNDENKSIAKNMLEKWKTDDSQMKKTLNQLNKIKQSEINYINKIQSLEAENARINALNGMLQTRVEKINKVLKVKAQEFTINLQKFLTNSSDMIPQVKMNVQVVLQTMKCLKNKQLQQQIVDKQKNIGIDLDYEAIKLQNLPINRLRKSPAILRKNIYGYYQNPQLKTYYNTQFKTKHYCNNKQTQTIPNDLSILITYPVLEVNLIDGYVKPQRNRHCIDFYVRIYRSEDNYVSSYCRNSMEPVWNEKMLLKNYDFPFLKIQLMNKSKGLRNQVIGSGRTPIAAALLKTINIKSDKGEYEGRIRLGLNYPQGNIFQLIINSATLITKNLSVLNQIIEVSCEKNEHFLLQFQTANQTIYFEKSFLVIENCETSIKVKMVKLGRKGVKQLLNVNLKQGQKTICINLGQNCQLLLSISILLIVCANQQPELIQKTEMMLTAESNRYFSVRAAHPIKYVIYANITLNSNIKFPLVYRYNDQFTSLLIMKQSFNHRQEKEIINPLLQSSTEIVSHNLLKTPTQIYEFFLISLQGNEITFNHESKLFQRLLKQIKLSVKQPKQNSQFVKQFHIESAELMQNHYKIFHRTFKKIGYIKFKVGYVIHQNLLSLPKVIPIREQPIHEIKSMEGIYFILFEVTDARMINSSEYSCCLNKKQTPRIKGKHAIWNYQIVIQCSFNSQSVPKIPFKLIQHKMIGSDQIVCQGQIELTQHLLTLGCLLIKIDNQGSYLRFGKIIFPSSAYQFHITQIKGYIEQQADWISEIDPYIKIQAMGQLIHKTEIMQNKGSHPIWTNLNFNRTIITENQQLLKCYIYDQDLIGHDDYLGKSQFTLKNVQQLRDNKVMNKLRSNITKQNKICGNLQISGIFKQNKQQFKKLIFHEQSILNSNIKICRISIYKIILKDQILSDDQGWFQSSTCNIFSNIFNYNKQSLKNASFTIWLKGKQKIDILLKKKVNSFFKSTVHQVAYIRLKIPQNLKKLTSTKFQILSLQQQIIGKCQILFEPILKINYLFIHSYTCCKQNIKFFSDVNDNLQFQCTTITNMQILHNNQNVKKLLFYNDSIFVSKNQNKIQISQTINQNIHQINQNNQILCRINMHKSLNYQTLIQNQIIKNTLKKQSKFKKIKYLHWQPIKHNAQIEIIYKLILEKVNKQQHLLVEHINQIYNIPYENHQFQSQIFSVENLPSSISIFYNVKGIQKFITNIKIHNVQKGISKYQENKGILCYELKQCQTTQIQEILISSLYLRMKKYIDKNQTGINQLLVSISYQNTKVNYSKADRVGQSSFVWNNISLAYPKKAINQPIRIKFLFQKNHQQLWQFDISPDKAYIVEQNNQFIAHLILQKFYTQIKQHITTDKQLHKVYLSNLEEITVNLTQQSAKQLKLKMTVGCQYQKFNLFYSQNKKYALQKSQNANSLWYIEMEEGNFTIKLQIFQIGFLKNTKIGFCNRLLTNKYLSHENFIINSEIKLNEIIVGQAKIKMKMKQKINYQRIDINGIISKANQMNLLVKLWQIGNNQNKSQKIRIRKQKNYCNNCEYSIENQLVIYEGNRENYQLQVINQNDQEVLGIFQLHNKLNKINYQSIIQPLRMKASQLNAIITLSCKVEQSIAQFSTSQSYQNYIKVSLQKMTYNGYLSNPNKVISIIIQTSSHKLNFIQHPISLYSSQPNDYFITAGEQIIYLTLKYKSEQIGIAELNPPFLSQQSRVALFLNNQNNKQFAICKLNIQHLNASMGSFFQVTNIEVSQLPNTEYLAEMTPYLQLSQESQLTKQCQNYYTDISRGQNDLFWQTEIISNKNIKVTVKDKDMFFDDYIGEAVFSQSIIEMEEASKTVMTNLISKDSSQIAGKIKAHLKRIKLDELELKHEQKVAQAKFYVLKISSFSNDLKKFTHLSAYLQLGSQLHKIFSLTILSNLNQIILQQLLIPIFIDFRLFISNQNKSNIPLNVILNYQNQKYKQTQIIEVKRSNSELYIPQIECDQNQKFRFCQIHQLTSLSLQICTLQRIYIWMHSMIDSQHLVITLSSVHDLLRIQLGNQQIQNQSHVLKFDMPKLFRLYQGAFVMHLYDKNIGEIGYFQVMLNSDDIALKNGILDARIILQNSKSPEDLGIAYLVTKNLRSEGSLTNFKISLPFKLDYLNQIWLQLLVIQAQLETDLQIFSKMDPYCRIQFINNQNGQLIQNKYQTTIKNNIGMHPIWNQVFILALNYKDQFKKLRISVIDSELTFDRQIAFAELQLHQVTQVANRMVLQLSDKGKLKCQVCFTRKHIIFTNIESIRIDKIQVHQQIIKLTHIIKQEIIIGKCYPIMQSVVIHISVDNQIWEANWYQIQHLNGEIMFIGSQIRISFILFE